MKKSSYLLLFFTVVYYIVFLALYLVESINEISFLIALFVALSFLLINVRTIKQKNESRNIYKVSIGVLSLLLAYEFILIGYIAPKQYNVLTYEEPVEVIEGSNIYTVGVRRLLVEQLKNPDTLEMEGYTVLSVKEITNATIYSAKNRQLLTWVGMKEEGVDSSAANVKKFLRDSHKKSIEDFYQQEKIAGDSAGLSLATSSLLNSKGYRNQVKIAITGSITNKGFVEPVGYINEKIQTTELAGIKHLIMPIENKNDASNAVKDLNNKIQLYYVKNVDEAILLIKEINESEKSF